MNVSPGHRAEPPSPAENQRPLTLMKLVRSRSKVNYESRASNDVLRSRPGSRRHGLCGKRPTAQKKDQFARSDKSHIVQHKTGRKGKATGGLAAGNPARPRRHRFMMHNVFLSYGRGSTGRAVAPPSAPTPQLNEVRRGRNAANVAGGSLVSFRVRRFWVFCLQLKRKSQADAGGWNLADVWAGEVRAARAPERCVPLARHGTAQPARARFWQWKVF